MPSAEEDHRNVIRVTQGTVDSGSVLQMQGASSECLGPSALPFPVGSDLKSLTEMGKDACQLVNNP
jgi:hypothetical protein